MITINQNHDVNTNGDHMILILQGIFMICIYLIMIMIMTTIMTMIITMTFTMIINNYFYNSNTMVKTTPRKIDMGPKNHLFAKEKHFFKPPLLCSIVVFQGESSRCFLF